MDTEKGPFQLKSRLSGRKADFLERKSYFSLGKVPFQLPYFLMEFGLGTRYRTVIGRLAQTHNNIEILINFPHI